MRLVGLGQAILWPASETNNNSGRIAQTAQTDAFVFRARAKLASLAGARERLKSVISPGDQCQLIGRAGARAERSRVCPAAVKLSRLTCGGATYCNASLAPPDRPIDRRASRPSSSPSPYPTVQRVLTGCPVRALIEAHCGYAAGCARKWPAQELSPSPRALCTLAFAPTRCCLITYTIKVHKLPPATKRTCHLHRAT